MTELEALIRAEWVIAGLKPKVGNSTAEAELTEVWEKLHNLIERVTTAEKSDDLVIDLARDVLQERGFIICEATTREAILKIVGDEVGSHGEVFVSAQEIDDLCEHLTTSGDETSFSDSIRDQIRWWLKDNVKGFKG